jgi:hypothetical protein
MDIFAANRLRVASSSRTNSSHVEGGTVDSDGCRKALGAETEAVENAKSTEEAGEIVVVITLRALDLIAALYRSWVARSDILAFHWSCGCKGRGNGEDDDGELEEHVWSEWTDEFQVFEVRKRQWGGEWDGEVSQED